MSQELMLELRGMWGEVDRLRVVLRSLEWAGTEVVYYDGETAVRCPSCRGFKPGEVTHQDDSQMGHFDDCKLLAALGPRPPHPINTLKGNGE